jgi:hypothetical protein
MSSALAALKLIFRSVLEGAEKVAQQVKAAVFFT